MLAILMYICKFRCLLCDARERIIKFVKAKVIGMKNQWWRCDNTNMCSRALTPLLYAIINLSVLRNMHVKI